MGNSRAGPEAAREVVLCLQGVHNVAHATDEVYYGLATDHTSDAEKPVTPMQPVRFVVDQDAVLSVRVYLHRRGYGGGSAQDRPVGQISIPISQTLELIGPGLFQVWLLLEETTDYAGIRRSRVLERFRHAFQRVPDRIHSPRICITLLEASVDPQEWMHNDGKDRSEYYDVLLASHAQHVQLLSAYYADIQDASERSTAPSSGPISEEGVEQVVALQEQLNLLTVQVKRRIDLGAENLSKLETQLHSFKQEETKLWQERTYARKRLEVAKWNHLQLQDKADDRPSSEDAELEQLREEMATLRQEKANCMKMVQDIFTVADRGAVDHVLSPVHAAAARQLLEIRSCGAMGLEILGGKEDLEAIGEPRHGHMLPDPEDLLGDLPLDPL